MATKRATSKSKAKPKAKRAKPSPKAAAIPAPQTTERYELENDMRTLQRAQEIRSDTKRFGQVKKLAATEAAKLKNIAK